MSQAQAAHKEWNRLMEEERRETSEKCGLEGESEQLHARADRSERCALTAIETAALAMDEGERAMLRTLHTPPRDNLNLGSRTCNG
jgi:hypothetical protein